LTTLALRLKPSEKLKTTPKPVREKYTQGWLNYFAMKVPEFIATYVAQNHPFQSRTGYAATKWKGEVVGGNKIRITSLVAYTYWLNHGVRPHQMTYLLNSKSAIPIQTAGGTIFRRPSVAGMLAGKWRHPGLPATHFLEQSIDVLAKHMQQQYPDLVVESMKW
jgi:hypothetical protein